MIIDNRAGSKQFVSLVRGSELGVLEFGDMCFYGKGPRGKICIGVEVKTIDDLVGSLASGRLRGRQLPGMLDSYDVSWLVYYGLHRENLDTGDLEIWRGRKWQEYQFSPGRQYSYLRNSLLSVSASGVLINSMSSIDGCAKWVESLRDWWVRPWDSHVSFKNSSLYGSSLVQSGLTDKEERVAKVALSLSNIGYKIAFRAAKKFQSVAEMSSAPAQEWAGLKGVGKMKAAKIVKMLNGL